jgi:FKBP-type peptidyl-prolyl cis-trans isomerase
MRRRLAAVSAAGMLIALPSLAACGGADDSPVRVTGAFGRQPDVTIPTTRPGDALSVSTPVDGKGAKVAKGDLVVADYVGYRWGRSGGKLIASSYAGGGHPSAFPSGKLVPGLDKALVGARVGSRVVAVIPPRDGYGDAGNAQLEVTSEDSLVFVLDVVGTYPARSAVTGAVREPEARMPRVGTAQPGQPPPVTIPRARPPRGLQVHTLIQGTGEPVRQGQLLALQYTGVFWRDGKVFDSSWTAGRVYAATIGRSQVVKGWDQGLVGQRVGSRVLLVVPPAWGYGAKGLKQAGIKGTDTLVFVVDVLGAH